MITEKTSKIDSSGILPYGGEKTHNLVLSGIPDNIEDMDEDSEEISEINRSLLVQIRLFMENYEESQTMDPRQLLEQILKNASQAESLRTFKYLLRKLLAIPPIPSMGGEIWAMVSNIVESLTDNFEVHGVLEGDVVP